MRNALPTYAKDIEDFRKKNDALKEDVAQLKDKISNINHSDLNAIEIHGLQRLAHVNEDNKFGVAEHTG